MSNDITEIEKRFFETFGIEARYIIIRGCENGITFYANDCNIPSCKGCSKAIREKVYPQITDRILLELICIANHESVYIDFEGTDVETLKNSLLGNFVYFKRIIPKRKVQALFKDV